LSLFINTSNAAVCIRCCSITNFNTCQLYPAQLNVLNQKYRRLNEQSLLAKISTSINYVLTYLYNDYLTFAFGHSTSTNVTNYNSYKNGPISTYTATYLSI
jgi:hypothetical protein